MLDADTLYHCHAAGLQRLARSLGVSLRPYDSSEHWHRVAAHRLAYAIEIDRARAA